MTIQVHNLFLDFRFGEGLKKGGKDGPGCSALNVHLFPHPFIMV